MIIILRTVKRILSVVHIHIHTHTHDVSPVWRTLILKLRRRKKSGRMARGKKIIIFPSTRGRTDAKSHRFVAHTLWRAHGRRAERRKTVQAQKNGRRRASDRAASDASATCTADGDRMSSAGKRQERHRRRGHVYYTAAASFVAGRSGVVRWRRHVIHGRAGAMAPPAPSPPLGGARSSAPLVRRRPVRALFRPTGARARDFTTTRVHL